MAHSTGGGKYVTSKIGCSYDRIYVLRALIFAPRMLQLKDIVTFSNDLALKLLSSHCISTNV